MPVHRSELSVVHDELKPIIQLAFGSPRDQEEFDPLKALIDTGASHSSASRALINKFKLEKIGTTHQYGHDDTYLGEKDAFWGSLKIQSNNPYEGQIIVNCIVVEGTTSSADMILGMSALRTLKTTFHPDKSFTLEWDRPKTSF